MVDVPLLRKYVEWVEEQSQLPEDLRTWVQMNWKTIRRPRDQRGRWIPMREGEVCGTAYCVAGRLTVDAGFEIRPGGRIISAPLGQGEWIGKDCDSYAMDRLGIDFVEASDLFDAGNTAQKIREIAERIAGEKL